MNRHFQLRTCTDHVFDHRKRPCILYQIDRCPAPCVYDVPQRGVPAVGGGRGRVPGGARDASSSSGSARAWRRPPAALRFEDAARLRDQLQAVERSLEKQRVLMADRADRDVVGLYREGPDLVVQVLSMRGGKLQDSRSHPFREQEFPDDEILSSFLSLYYEQNPAPDEVLLPLEPAAAEALADVLSERRGRRVRLLTPAARREGRPARGGGDGTPSRASASWHEKDERREKAHRGARPRARTSRGRRAGWSATTSRPSRARSRSARACR